MAKAELVYANVLDNRIRRTQGDGGPSAVYCVSVPGRAIQFSVLRMWKAPQGLVNEQFTFTAPSGKVTYTSPPGTKRMLGAMDLTVFDETVEDAHFGEPGRYVASFLIDRQVIGEIEFELYMQAPATKLPKDFEDALKKSDVIWVGVEENGRPRTIPAWFAYKNGSIFLLSAYEESLGEQMVPGLPAADELLVVTRRKLRETALGSFHASVRLHEEGPEWEAAAALLADRRRSRFGPPAESIGKWRGKAAIAELVPVVPS